MERYCPVGDHSIQNIIFESESVHPKPGKIRVVEEEEKSSQIDTSRYVQPLTTVEDKTAMNLPFGQHLNE